MTDEFSLSPAGPGAAGSAPASFSHSYRTRRTGMDSSTRRLVMAASALGLVLLAGMGFWTFSGSRVAGVPVIEADSRPLRIKPENPGGMTVMGANDQVMGGHGDGEAGDLAPQAERPDPQALRAQRQVPTPPPATQTSPAAQASPATPATVPAASPGPAPATVASAPAAPHRPSTGGLMVQVAAVDNEASAATEWQRLAHKAPELLGERKPVVTRLDRDGKVFWRLRTGGFADMAEATEFCRKVRAKGVGCSIAS